MRNFLIALLLFIPFLCNGQRYIQINGAGVTTTINAPGKPGTVSIVAPDQPPVDMTIYLLVMAGESNSGGQALNALATAGELAIRPELSILNNTTLLFEDLDIGTNNLIGHQGMASPELRHSWELEIANLAEAETIRNPTNLVKTGQGGATIAQLKSGGTFSGISPWTRFTDRVDAALAIINPPGIKFALLYSQGINDGIAETNIATWKTDTKAHFALMRSVYGNFPIVMTKLMSTASTAAWVDDYNTAIEEICAEIEWCYFADATGAGTQDDYHWSYAGQKVMAQRLIQKLIDNGFILN